MVTATVRVRINTTTYMPVDGQWQIVLSGSVIDLPPDVRLTGSSVDQTFSEPPGMLAAHGKATPVRNLRTR